MVIGALTLAVICVVLRQSLPRAPRAWGHLLVVAVLLCVAPYLLFAWAEQHMTSGLASIYNATTPLMTMAVAMAVLPSEPPTRDRLFGLLLGFAGVIVLVSPWSGLGRADAAGQVACLGATACYGVAFTYVRRYITPLGLTALSVACVQVGLGAGIMTVLSPLLATQPVQLSPRVLLSMVILGAVGTGLAFVWNTNVVASWGATNASTVTYLTPVVGVALGVLVLGESVTWSEPLGAALVIVGIAVTQGRFRLLATAVARARSAPLESGRDYSI